MKGISRILVSTVVLAAFAAPWRAEGGEGAASDKPLATERHQTKLLVEVLRVHRTSDGLVSIVWRYRNESDAAIALATMHFHPDIVGRLYVVDCGTKPPTKYMVAKFKEGDSLASGMDDVSVKPGMAQTYWAKFALPEETKMVTMYLPDTPPMEDLPVSGLPEKVKPGTSPLGTEPHNLGLAVDVTRVRRTSDGFVEVRWRYRNESDKDIALVPWGYDPNIVGRLYVVDPASRTKSPVAKDDKGAFVASEIPTTTIKPKNEAEFWARFPAPPECKYVTVYVPDTLPFEDLPVTERSEK